MKTSKKTLGQSSNGHINMLACLVARRKKHVCLVLGALLAMSVAGCGGDNNTSENPDSASSSESESKNENVEIRFSWWGSEARNTATLEAIEAYESQNPDVTIVPEYTGYEGYQEKLYAQIAAGNTPDIFTSVTEWYSYLYDADAMADMTDAFDMSGHSDAYIEACSYEGKVYGVSTSLNGYGIVCNQTLADELGITLPAVTDTYTWDDLADIWIQAAEKSGGSCYGVMDPRYAGWAMEAFGYTYLSKEEPYMYSNEGLTIEADDVTQFIDYFDNLPEGTVMPADESFAVDPQMDAPVASGKVLMELESTGTFATMQSQTEDQLTLIPYPRGENGESANCARPGLIQNVASTSAHPEECFAFLDWFTNSEEAALILGTTRGVLPTEVQRQALLNNSEGVSREDQIVIDCLDVINKDENMHTFLPGPMGIDEARMNTFENVVSEAVFGYISSEEAGEKYIEEANKVLASYNN